MLLFNSRQGDKEIHNFPKGISPKLNIMARLEFELAYYEVAVQHDRLKAKENLPFIFADISNIEFDNK